MNRSLQAFIIGLVASLFSTSTYIINDNLSKTTVYWMWTVSLRFFIVFVILLFFMLIKKRLLTVLREINKSVISWIIWSTIGFSLFFSALTLSSFYAPSWLVASSFQVTIFAGALLSPLFFPQNVDSTSGSKLNRIPFSLFPGFSLILTGVFLCNFSRIDSYNLSLIFKFIVLIIIAAFSYPLGNRKIMVMVDSRLSTVERVFGMILCNLPALLIFMSISYNKVGLPPVSQVTKASAVAIFSGLIATNLYFHATDLVKSDSTSLAFVESTQVGEIFFSLLFGIYILGNNLPTNLQWIGVFLIIAGMFLNSFVSKSIPKTYLLSSDE